VTLPLGNPMSVILRLVGLAAVSVVIIWRGSILLERAAGRLSRYYGLPLSVHGAVVIAVGSSFPELSSVVISTLVHDEFALGVGTIVGSAIFNLLVIPALSVLSSDRLLATRDIVHRDIQFYIISILVLFITFALGATYVPGGTNSEAILTPAVVLVPLATYLVYVFLQYQDTQDHVAADDLAVSPPREWGLLAVGLVLIAVGVEGIVRAALGFGEMYDVPSLLWGLTVITAATSLPDAIVSVRAARDDADITSLTNVLGSNTFNLLVAIPVGVVLAGSATINFLSAIPLMAFLAFATVVFLVFTRTGLELGTLEAYALLGLYVLFIGWVGLETLGVIETVRGF